MVDRSIHHFASAVAASAILGLAPDARTQTNELVSLATGGQQGNGHSRKACITRDARYVLFTSDATNFDAADSNGLTDVFLRDRLAATTIRASVDSSGGEANGPSDCWAISDDGTVVVFSSSASNLAAGDNNGLDDVFARDLTTGVTELISVSLAGGVGNGRSTSAGISADGRFVVFTSTANNLITGDGNGLGDIFIRDRAAATTTRVSLDGSGNELNRDSVNAAISADGRYVAFDTFANIGADMNASLDVYRRDLSNGQVTWISSPFNGGFGRGGSWLPTISDDGSRVAFVATDDGLVSDDYNGQEDAFVRDVPSNTTTCVSRSSEGQESHGITRSAIVSGDGRFVAFDSEANNLVPDDGNGFIDAFVHCVGSAMTLRESVANDGSESAYYSADAVPSQDGAEVVFACAADDLVAGDSNLKWDVVLHSRSLAPANSSSYGSGYAGTNGIPSLTSRSSPVLNTDVVFDVGNSSGRWGLAFVVIGLTSQDLATNRGGHLLVVPFATVVVPLPPNGTTLEGIVPPLEALAGIHAYLQAIEPDAGAAYGFSFSAGLDLTLGY